MDDIAKHAGVSQTTVSLVLNKRNRKNGTISEETKNRVLSSATALNYRTNEVAKSMATGKNRVLGILMSPDAENAIRILTGAIDAAQKQDYLLKVLHLSFGAVDQDVIERCQKWRLAGVIAFGLDDETNKYLRTEFVRVGMPLALIDNASYVDDQGVAVRSDDAQGIRLVVSHLAGLGHRRIAHLGGSPSMLSVSRDRYFREAMAEAGLSVPSHWVPLSSWYEEGCIEEAASALLSDPVGRPTAIVCSSDMIAMTVQRVARSRGLACPSDLSVTGYSDSMASRFADPPLTTVEQSFSEIGRIAATQIIGFTEGRGIVEEDSPDRLFIVPTRLIVRGSTASVV